MPLTPFHIVAGLSIKSIFTKYFSWSIFALTNIIIDVEVIYYILTIGEASHKFFHTLIGATIVAILCAILGIPICEWFLKFWNNCSHVTHLFMSHHFGKMKVLQKFRPSNFYCNFVASRFFNIIFAIFFVSMFKLSTI